MVYRVPIQKGNGRKEQYWDYSTMSILKL